MFAAESKIYFFFLSLVISLLYCFILLISGYRLSDFYIGVTDTSPYDIPPSPYPPNYRVCQYHSGPVKDGATETIVCQFPVFGRYVVVQLTSADQVLTLCEVEVHTGKHPWKSRPLCFVL